MMIAKRTAAAGVTAACLAASVAQPQGFPARSVRLVTEFSPGSGGDLVLRILAPRLSDALGQPVVIENRGGGGGVIAAELVARSAPDGYTILGGTPNALIARRFLARTMAVDVTRELTPITTLGDTTTVIVLNPAEPYRTLKEVIDFARANPGKLSYGTSGYGSIHHLSQEQIRLLTGAEIVHVPYKSGLAAIQEVAAGRIPMSYTVLGSGMAFIKPGKVRVLASVGARRSPAVPDVPAVGEFVPGFDKPPSWTALFGPADLARPALQRLHAESAKVLADPAAREKFNAVGWEPSSSTPEEFAATIRREIELVGGIVKAAGIKPVD